MRSEQDAIDFGANMLHYTQKSGATSASPVEMSWIRLPLLNELGM